ncbi:hypothetical protein IWW34DRAFT_872554 [Fusarium oxysporum f. sp. albedinis]|nr:hypothetical protein IWW34DRAFT_872554 [Fusarium oxysporum f. sp. albedinis]KAK2669118.1 hypothetical protein RAB80_014644 [Fusarium oxysporum f. sp. vasinfectum]
MVFKLWCGQQTLRQSFTRPGFRAVTISLCDKEALSALGESKDAASLVPSKDDSDTEDEDDDEGDDSQTGTTPTGVSIADQLDSTGTNPGTTESKAATGETLRQYYPRLEWKTLQSGHTSHTWDPSLILNRINNLLVKRIARQIRLLVKMPTLTPRIIAPNVRNSASAITIEITIRIVIN